MLEINQAGLSWLTILKKREAFRRAFDGFDPERVAGYGARDKRRLLKDAGIVRNRLKIDAAIANARTVLELRRSHGSFAGWLGAHLYADPGKGTPRHNSGRPPRPRPRSKGDWVALFKRTFRFTGGEIVGEFLLSTGYLPGAHRESCPVYRTILRLEPAWSRAKPSPAPRPARPPPG
jgi:DNA-3-methyladenine glycosylase I